MAAEAIFDEIFTVDKMDPDGKKFDKVSRIEASVEQSAIKMQLDVNTEIYRIGVNDKFTMMLASTLSSDGTPDTGYFTQGGRKTLADKYEYVMHGKLYKITDGAPGTIVYVFILIYLCTNAYCAH
ncbi:hypothetical protein IFM89_000976 [Coptis chinensis]|uniref:Uncharacterized protein n=1 Tax=Coptis chinensis TaxID=261450 RepID=A0A835MC52_9MAGN|nr:hypothetical protein IFM89_000976 [Coptis chinensis]